MMYFLSVDTDFNTRMLLRKNQKGFRRNQFTHSQISAICGITEGIFEKYFQTTHLYLNFLKVFYPINREKMNQIFAAYDFQKETNLAMRMLKNYTKATVCSFAGDTDFIDIVDGAL